MKPSDIRSNFHNLIDRIDNESLLMKFYDLMIKSTTSKEGQLYKQLTLSRELRKVDLSQ